MENNAYWTSILKREHNQYEKVLVNTINIGHIEIVMMGTEHECPVTILCQPETFQSLAIWQFQQELLCYR